MPFFSHAHVVALLDQAEDRCGAQPLDDEALHVDVELGYLSTEPPPPDRFGPSDYMDEEEEEFGGRPMGWQPSGNVSIPSTLMTVQLQAPEILVYSRMQLQRALKDGEVCGGSLCAQTQTTLLAAISLVTREVAPWCA